MERMKDEIRAQATADRYRGRPAGGEGGKTMIAKCPYVFSRNFESAIWLVRD